MRLPGSKSILRANRRWAAVRAKSTLSEILAIQIKHSIAELSARDGRTQPDRMAWESRGAKLGLRRHHR